MTKITQRINVHRWKCPECGKEIVATTQRQFDWNCLLHKWKHKEAKKHGNKENP